ncbi:hypothetical protein SAMN05421721_10191 [Ectothiorhodospira mobilis]|uniref:DUF2058 domain-containing protein n=1 Tax=Ectothiorhodospira mobilis TaxID=195064 RepID=A0A1I4P9U1_ECTMO|nr:DUF2058 family protein [Ectothiorhodospira mobilis]SFM24380.1 hypothetical protein SAMN05421721_10191 [Ectothiorhodospira mobilis]
MTQSLREQLLQAGLVSEERVRQAEAPAPRKSGKGRRGKGPRRAPRKGQAPGGGARTAPRQEAAPASGTTDRALKARLRELVSAHRENSEQADRPYHFQVGKTIKHVYVTPPQQQALAEGRLCIAFLDGRRHLLPAEVGREMLRLDPKRTVLFPAEEAGE